MELRALRGFFKLHVYILDFQTPKLAVLHSSETVEENISFTLRFL